MHHTLDLSNSDEPITLDNLYELHKRLRFDGLALGRDQLGVFYRCLQHAPRASPGTKPKDVGEIIHTAAVD